MSKSDDEEDEDILQGLARPQLNMMSSVGDNDGDDGEDSEDEQDGGGEDPVPVAPTQAAHPLPPKVVDEQETPGEHRLLDAEAAFGEAGSLELDPFRMATHNKPMAEPNVGGQQPGEAPRKGASKSAGAASNKIYVGGLPQTSTDASLLRFFARYGKVQEAVAKSGFGFVTFVNDKGARFCLQQAGEPPVVTIDGAECKVSYAQHGGDGHSVRLHKMPARGNVEYLGLAARRGENQKAGSSSRDARSAIARQAVADQDDLEEEEGGRPKKRAKEAKEIVTVSRRQDAEPLDKRPITMREIFPKEFWKI